MSRNPLRPAVAVVFVAAALVTAGPTAYSQTAFTDSSGNTHGLWRDGDGELWCGGVCGVGQKCCTIVTKDP